MKSCLEIFRFACDRGFTRLSVKPVVKGGLGSGRKQKAFERTDCRERGESVTSSCHQWVSAGHSRIVSKGSAVPKEEFNDIKKNTSVSIQRCSTDGVLSDDECRLCVTSSLVARCLVCSPAYQIIDWSSHCAMASFFLLPCTGWTYHWGCQGQGCGSRGMFILVSKPIISF